MTQHRRFDQRGGGEARRTLSASARTAKHALVALQVKGGGDGEGFSVETAFVRGCCLRFGDAPQPPQNISPIFGATFKVPRKEPYSLFPRNNALCVARAPVLCHSPHGGEAEDALAEEGAAGGDALLVGERERETPDPAEGEFVTFDGKNEKKNNFL